MHERPENKSCQNGGLTLISASAEDAQICYQILERSSASRQLKNQFKGRCQNTHLGGWRLDYFIFSTMVQTKNKITVVSNANHFKSFQFLTFC